MQILSYEKMIVLTIVTLSAVTKDNGRMSDILVMIGLKSMLSLLVGARLILIIHCDTSASIDS
jgi:hypothetical protein